MKSSNSKPQGTSIFLQSYWHNHNRYSKNQMEIMFLNLFRLTCISTWGPIQLHGETEKEPLYLNCCKNKVLQPFVSHWVWKWERSPEPTKLWSFTYPLTRLSKLCKPHQCVVRPLAPQSTQVLRDWLQYLQVNIQSYSGYLHPLWSRMPVWTLPLPQGNKELL